MFISVSKLHDRYAFLVGDQVSDPPEAYLRSLYDFDLVPGLEPTYSTFPEAHSAASRVVHFMSSAIQARKVSALKKTSQEDKVEHYIPPEDRIVDHFSEQYRLLDRRLRQILVEDEDEQVEMLDFFLHEIDAVEQGIGMLLHEIDEDSSNIGEIKGVRKDIASLKHRAQKSSRDITRQRHARVQLSTSNTVPKVLKLAESAALSLVHAHETIRVERLDESNASGLIIARLEDENGHVCDLHFSEDLYLCGISPSRRVASKTPYHSRDFMETYWEPVISSVGHFMLEGKGLLLSTADSGGSSSFKATRVASNEETRVNVISNPDDGTWWLRPQAMSRKASSDLIGKEVKCTKVTLPSYYGRTGTVLNEEDKGSYKEISVDFRRGLGVMVLTEGDLEIVPI